MLPEPMTHPRSLAQAPFGYAPFDYAQGRQDRRDKCAKMGHPAKAKPSEGFLTRRGGFGMTSWTSGAEAPFLRDLYGTDEAVP